MVWFDVLLLVALVVVMPLRALVNSFGSRKVAAQAESRLTRYRRSIAIALALTAALAAIWSATQRPLAALGFDWPVSTRGIIGLAIAGVLLIGLIATAHRAPVPPDAAMREASMRLLPQGAVERRWFVAFGLTLGVAWEVLYRGYLLWLLPPHIGLAGAIVVAATAYGLAHGYQGRKQLISSIATALVFTVAFALTQSLWWLIVIHAALPMVGLLVQARPAPIDTNPREATF